MTVLFFYYVDLLRTAFDDEVVAQQELEIRQEPSVQIEEDDDDTNFHRILYKRSDSNVAIGYISFLMVYAECDDCSFSRERYRSSIWEMSNMDTENMIIIFI